MSHTINGSFTTGIQASRTEGSITPIPEFYVISDIIDSSCWLAKVLIKDFKKNPKTFFLVILHVISCDSHLNFMTLKDFDVGY